MHPVEVRAALSTLTLLVDTREQPTERFKKRVKETRLPYIRQKLNFGDYSGFCKWDGNLLDLSNTIAIERKMSLDELCQCFTSGRDRFEREFQRCQKANGRIYLLVEGASWEKIFNHDYKSGMRPQSLEASILSWQARYNCKVIFCATKSSGELIRAILYYEAKRFLEAM